MYPPVATKDPSQVEAAVRCAYTAMFPSADATLVARAFAWTVDSFRGNFGGFQPIDIEYHDLEHTMQGTLCLSRLLHARQLAGATPRVSQHEFDLALLAILLHDTGYLKTKDDTEGTGAKYTAVHVERSAQFARRLLGEKQFPETDIRAVQNMIRCTGINVRVASIPFQSDVERVLGQAVGTSDLLGQMAADDYVDRLPELYDEFKEAAKHDKDNAFIGRFSDAEDLMRQTPLFWKNFVLPKLNTEFGGLFRFLNEPYPDGPNFYVERIESNVERLRQKFDSSAA